jgi:CrcB protein
VLVAEGWPGAHPLLRPFLATGVLGGYTTFSAYVVDTVHLARAGAPATALAYLFGTLAAALVATYAGVLGTRLLLRRRPA